MKTKKHSVLPKTHLLRGAVSGIFLEKLKHPGIFPLDVPLVTVEWFCYTWNCSNVKVWQSNVHSLRRYLEPSSISYYALRYFTLLFTLLLVIIVPVLLSFFGSFRRSKEMVDQYENMLQWVKMKEIHKESTVMGFELYYFHGSWLCKFTKRDASAPHPPNSFVF